MILSLKVMSFIVWLFLIFSLLFFNFLQFYCEVSRSIFLLLSLFGFEKSLKSVFDLFHQFGLILGHDMFNYYPALLICTFNYCFAPLHIYFLFIYKEGTHTLDLLTLSSVPLSIFFFPALLRSN